MRAGVGGRGWQGHAAGGAADPKAIFPLSQQDALNAQVEGYLGEGGNITFLTFADTDHMQSARRFFYIKAARDWPFAQARA